MNRSMSLAGRSTEIVASPAWVRVNDFLTLDVDGSFGSSWWAVSVVTVGWLRPNAAAASPGRSTLERERDVERAGVTRRGDRHRGRGRRSRSRRCVLNGTWNLPPFQPVPCWTMAWSPSDAGPTTTSSAPPVAVWKPQMPAPKFVFGLAPTVSRMYGAPSAVPGPRSW